MLKIIDYVPSTFMTADATQLYDIFGAPTLIELPGKRSDVLSLSILLHGNETTGLLALQKVLARYKDTELPRGLAIFIGNVAAAAKGVRHLDKQPDFNRIWPGTDAPESIELEMMQKLVSHLAEKQLFANIDIHNNTGNNPHYACMTTLKHSFLHLAKAFGRTVVYFTRPKGVQCAAFNHYCPSITIECGKVGQASGVDHAANFIANCLEMEYISNEPVKPEEVDLYHTVATVKVPEEVSIGFGESDADLVLVEDFDMLNFRELSDHTVIGSVPGGRDNLLHVWDEAAIDRYQDFMHVENGELYLRKKVMPAMFTKNEMVIRQDCLGYLMERLDLSRCEI